MIDIEKKKLKWREIKEKVKIRYFKLACVLFVVFLSGCFFMKIKAHMVSGESMIPTLQNKDRLFIVKSKDPTRYSIITFQPNEVPNESYVKRVMGLPGDRIWLDQNTLYLNGQMAETNPTPADETNLSGIELPDGTLKVRVTWEVAAKLEGLTMIPDNQFFVLGDNRKHSADSRELGLIDRNKIEGVVTFRYYPLNRLGLIK
ncbi:signal peptidase I [Enterococcus sp. 7F3_DIV0205]|uniref:Signal peptidase I n=1 Tax=Candidatus Enterococcus palustris TaxID=1834189 RepID=A0AAQ3Y7Y2_9ENTE|nr:signal peptidase I [Enterococcus sp. 7F3_DIV0205]OTN82626.1 signal peptidase I [Enterococcus sp. 7F3_DIV0205]